MLLLARGAGIETRSGGSRRTRSESCSSQEEQVLKQSRFKGFQTRVRCSSQEEQVLKLKSGWYKVAFRSCSSQEEQVLKPPCSHFLFSHTSCSSQEEQVLKLLVLILFGYRVVLLLARGAGIETTPSATSSRSPPVAPRKRSRY